MRRFPLLFVPLFVAALGLTGCGTEIGFVTTGRAPPRAPKPRPASEVAVILTGPPLKRFVTLGTLEAAQASYLSLDDRRDVFAKMRERAGEIGCDAIIAVSDDGLASDPAMNQPRRVPFGDHAAWRAACILFQ